MASFRLAVQYAGLFAASAALLGAAVFWAARSSLERQTAGRIESETAFLREEFRSGGLDQLATVVEARGRGASALDYLLQDAAGRHLAGEIPSGQVSGPGWAAVVVDEAFEDDGRPEQVRALVSRLPDGSLLAVGDDVSRVAEVEKAVASAFLGTIGLAAALGIGGGVLLSRAFLAKVDAISRTAEAIIGGDLGRRVPVRGTDDDLDRLAGTLNRMLDRITALMGSLRQMSTDVAHDLRTPLSRLCQRLEDAREHATTVGEYRTAVAAAVGDAAALLETFSALLRIAQVEGASPSSGFRPVDLSALVESVADAYQPDAEQGGRALAARIAPGIAVRGDQELLTQAVANLAENAMRHTPPGTRIRIELCAAAAGPRLSVRDDGPGVPAADLPRLTDRFYRGERSRTTPGAGLGLSLVAAVADLHGARLRLRDAAPGLLAELTFPAEGAA